MSETPKTVFVTKYALTGGIKEAPVRTASSYDSKYLFLEGYSGGSIGPSDYRFMRDEAIKQAEAKKVAKLASLRKQIAKLEAMTFA